MDKYQDIANLSILKKACSKMLQEKYNKRITQKDLDVLISSVAREVDEEYTEMNLKLSEINNITLSKIKKRYELESQASTEHSLQPLQTLQTLHDTHTLQYKLYSQASQSQQSQQASQASQSQQSQQSSQALQILDDDLINYKLKELETRRQIIPTYVEENPETLQREVQNLTYKSNPISITIPPSANDRPNYKSFIINSLNRDWCKFPNRNLVKFNVSLDLDKNTFYPHCVCFPSFVKNATPYVIINLSDGVKNIMYTFTCSSILGNWDTWHPINNVEKIGLEKSVWTIKIYDFTNKELQLGKDSIDVVQASMVQDTFVLKTSMIDDELIAGDIIHIKCYNSTIVSKYVLQYSKEPREITIDTKDIDIDDFINAKVLVIKNQFSFIVKYDKRYASIQ